MWHALVFLGMLLVLVASQMLVAWLSFRASLRSERLAVLVRMIGAAAGWFVLVQFLRRSPQYLSWLLILFCAWTGAVSATVWYEIRYRERGIPVSVPLAGGAVGAALSWLLLRVIG